MFASSIISASDVSPVICWSHRLGISNSAANTSALFLRIGAVLVGNVELGFLAVEYVIGLMKEREPEKIFCFATVTQEDQVSGRYRPDPLDLSFQFPVLL